MSDLISRRAAIKAILDRMDVAKHCRDTKREEIQWILERLPSAQPEQRWIPCSERLPKPGYYITSNEYNGISEDFYYDGHFWNADKNAYEVIAWMPLPKPYKEGDTK